MSAAPKRSRFSDKPVNEPTMAPPSTAVPMGGSGGGNNGTGDLSASLAKVAKTETTTTTGSAPAWKLPESALVPLGKEISF